MSMIGNLLAADDDAIKDLLEEPTKIHDFLYGDDAENADTTDLDKAWHTIHFILTGSAWEGDFPHGFLVSAGIPIGEEDVGYGPARAFLSHEVHDIRKALDDISEAQFREQFSVEKMKKEDIYPSFGHASDEEEIPYFLEHFLSLKEFIIKVEASKRGLIVYLN